MPVRLTSTLTLAMDRETLSIVQLGLAFLLVFTAFNSAGYIQEGVLLQLSNATAAGDTPIDPAAGYNSLAIIYAVFTAANLLASPIVNMLTAKWAMVVGASCYLVFMILFVIKVMEWSLYLTSALLGFGAAKTLSGICGGIFLYVAFPSNASATLSITTVRTVYGSFSVINAVGILTLVLLRQPTTPRVATLPPTPDDGDQLVEESPRNPGVLDSAEEKSGSPPPSRVSASFAQAWVDFVDTLKLAMTPEMLLLTPGFFFTGLETAFWTGVYATCLTNTAAFTLAHNTTYALHAIFIGLGEVIGGGAFGLAGHRTNIYGRNPIIILGVIAHTAAYFLAYLILPSESPIQKTDAIAYMHPTVYVAFGISFMLGLADSCWNTQIYSLNGDYYKENSAPAFALFKLWQSLGACLSFVVSSKMGVEYQLMILVAFAFIGSLTFFPVEFKAAAKRHSLDKSS